MRIPDVLGSVQGDRLRQAFPGVDHRSILIRRLPTWLQGAMAGLHGLTIGRVIFIRDDADIESDRVAALIAHELAHVEQWRRQGPVGFLVRYWSDYLRGRLRGLGHVEAYRAIPAEVEARAAADRFVAAIHEE